MRDNCDILIKENLFCLYQNSEDPLCLKNIILYLHELVVIVVTSFFFNESNIYQVGVPFPIPRKYIFNVINLITFLIQYSKLSPLRLEPFPSPCRVFKH